MRIVFLLLALAARPAAAEVSWDEPSVRGSRTDPRLILTISGRTAARSKISVTGNSVFVTDLSAAGYRPLAVSAGTAVSADRRGNFSLDLEVPAGTVFVPLKIEEPSGATSEHQLVFEVSFDKVVQSMPEPPESPYRGIDVRVQLERATLKMAGLSGVATEYSGYGTAVSGHVYVLEKSHWRINAFLSSRVTSFKSSDLPGGEKEGLQYQALGPGLEISYGGFYLQGLYHWAMMDAYYVSSAALSKTLNFAGPSAAAGYNHRFKRLGLGVGVAQAQVPIAAGEAGDGIARRFDALTFSVNLVYYLGSPPMQFWGDLF